MNYIKVEKYLKTLLDKIRFKYVFSVLTTWGGSIILFRKKSGLLQAYRDASRT